MKETLLERLQREVREKMDAVLCDLQTGRAGKKDAFDELDYVIAHVLKEASGELEGLKKLELTHAEIQLLDRHEREEYNEDVTGYNQAIEDAHKLLGWNKI